MGKVFLVWSEKETICRNPDGDAFLFTEQIENPQKQTADVILSCYGNTDFYSDLSAKLNNASPGETITLETNSDDPNWDLVRISFIRISDSTSCIRFI